MQNQQLYQVTATDNQWKCIEEACAMLSLVQHGLLTAPMSYIPFTSNAIKEGLQAVHSRFLSDNILKITLKRDVDEPNKFQADTAFIIARALRDRETVAHTGLDVSQYPTLTLSEKQLNTIATACELLGRLMLGQANGIGMLIPFDDYQLGLELDEINQRYLQAYRDYVSVECDESGNRKADIPLDIWRKIARKDDFRMGSEPSISVVGVVSE